MKQISKAAWILSDEQKLIRLQYLMYGGYIGINKLKAIKAEIKNYYETVIDGSNIDLKNYLSTVLSNFYGTGFLACIETLQLMRELITKNYPKALEGYRPLVSSIESKLFQHLKDPRVIEKMSIDNIYFDDLFL